MKKNRRLTHETLEKRCMLAGGGLMAPALSSLPTAEKKLFIDFDGDIHRNWGSWLDIGGTSTNGPIPAYDTDGDATTFSGSELDLIRSIHSVVADKFAPFNIDVTTVDPGRLEDGRIGKVVVGGDGSWYNDGRERMAGGVAYHGGFWGDAESVAYCWANPTLDWWLGNCIAHEAGHMLGLDHQSQITGFSMPVEYRPGAIMGGGGRWRFGEASGRDSVDGSLDSNGNQDDVAELLNRGLELRPDDHSDSRNVSASDLEMSGLDFSGSGVIETESDVDVFKLPVGMGSAITVSVTGQSVDAMLDPKLELYDASGNLLHSATTAGPTESIVIPATTTNFYYLVVSIDGDMGDIYNLGAYNVNVVSNAGDTIGSAETIAGLDGVFTDGPLYGEHVRTSTVNGTDTVDWYRFTGPQYLGGRETIEVEIDNFVGEVRTFLYRDINNDGDIMDAGEWIADVDGSGTLEKNYSGTPTFYVAVYRLTGSNASYNLTVNADLSRVPFPIRMEAGQPLRVYDHIEVGDEDYVGGDHRWRSGLFYYHVNFEFQPYNSSGQFIYGYDANRDGRLQLGEISPSGVHNADINEIVNINGVRSRDVNGHLLLTSVRALDGPTNYRLESGVDQMPVLDGSTFSGSATDLRNLGDSRHGGLISDFLDGTDISDAILLPPASTNGVMEVSFKYPGAGAKFQLYGDFNQNDVFDQGEFLGESETNFFIQQDQGDTTPYYVVANFDPGPLEQVPYEIIYRDSFVTNPVGMSKDNPLPIEAGAVYEGYVSVSEVPELHRPDNFYRYDADEEGTLRLKLQPNSQQDNIFTAGLQVIRDSNQNGKLDDADRIAGFGGKKTATELDVTITDGTYFIVVTQHDHENAFDGQVDDYRLDVEVDAFVDDDTPVEIVDVKFRLDEYPIGVLVEFSEDVEMTLGHHDVEWFGPQSALMHGDDVHAAGDTYDNNNYLYFKVYDPWELTPGQQRVVIGAETLADPAGNLLQQGGVWVADFEAPDADITRDGKYDCADIDLLTAAIVAGSNQVRFDINLDGEINIADRDQWLVDAGAVQGSPTGGNPYLLGDANLDGAVDASDFNRWNENKFTVTSAWCQADFNTDGVVDASDFNVWNANKFQSSAGIVQRGDHALVKSAFAEAIVESADAMQQDKEKVAVQMPMASLWSYAITSSDQSRDESLDDGDRVQVLQEVFAKWI